jgi:ketosteroid isomerase-like protein
MSLYAPNVISFNFGPPLRYAGAENRRRAWQKLFDTYPGPIAYDVRDLNVTTQGELAFVQRQPVERHAG